MEEVLWSGWLPLRDLTLFPRHHGYRASIVRAPPAPSFPITCGRIGSSILPITYSEKPKRMGIVKVQSKQLAMEPMLLFLLPGAAWSCLSPEGPEEPRMLVAVTLPPSCLFLFAFPLGGTGEGLYNTCAAPALVFQQSVPTMLTTVATLLASP